MPDRPSRVRLQLGNELQTCRTLAGVNQRDLAAGAGISQSLVSRVERGERLLSRPDAVAWLRQVDAGTDVRDRVMALLEAAHTETRTFADLLENQDHLQDVMRDQDIQARLMQDFAPTVIPGLLQTADYARHVIPLADLTGAFDHRAALAARIDRQGMLREPGRTFQFLITERLLYWEPAPGVLAPQLAHLAAAIQLDTVELGVLPDNYVGALPWHNFFVRYPHDDGPPPYVAIELIHGEQIITDPESVDAYRLLWDRSWTAAITGAAAGELIQSRAGANPSFRRDPRGLRDHEPETPESGSTGLRE